MQSADRDRFLEGCRPLALHARASLALLIAEKFCREHGINHPEIDQFFEYMWEGPTSDFAQWEASKPPLVVYGIGGGELPAALAPILEAAEIEEPRFRDVISGAILVLWGSFWGAAEDEPSFGHLKRVVSRARVGSLPPLTPFRFLLFSDGGWTAPSTEDLAYWKGMRGYA